MWHVFSLRNQSYELFHAGTYVLAHTYWHVPARDEKDKKKLENKKSETKKRSVRRALNKVLKAELSNSDDGTLISRNISNPSHN